MVKTFHWSVALKGGGGSLGTEQTESDAVKAVEREVLFFTQNSWRTVESATITAACAKCDGAGKFLNCRRHVERWQHSEKCWKVCPECKGKNSSVTTSLT